MIMCNYQNMSLKELEDIRKICGEQEQYYHRKRTQAMAVNNAKLAVILGAKSSTAKKSRMLVTNIIDNILEGVVDTASEANHE